MQSVMMSSGRLNFERGSLPVENSTRNSTSHVVMMNGAPEALPNPPREAGEYNEKGSLENGGNTTNAMNGTTNNATREGVSNSTEGRTNQEFVNPLRPLVATESAEKRESRKRKLFCLFQSYDNAKLDELAKNAKLQTISQLLSSRKKPAAVAAQSKRPSDLPAAVGLFPHPALAFSGVRSSDKTLADLEEETLSFHIPPPGAREQRSSPSLRTFSIQFQECSIAAIARWSSVRANLSRQTQERPCKRACVDTNFRRCGVCGNWGHYEKHCAHVQPVEAYRILPASRRVSNKPLPRAPSSANQVKVRVEDCDGFMIEQRAVPRPESSNVAEKPKKQNDVIATTIGGVRISASASYAGPAAPFKEGDVVAWKLSEDRMLTGKVESVDVGRGLVKARCIRAITLDTAKNKSDSEDVLVGVLFSLPAKRLRLAKRSETSSEGRDVLSTSQRNKRAKLLNEDGTIRSQTTPKLLYDGTYQRPRGRKPGGMVWDSTRGLWTPAK